MIDRARLDAVVRATLPAIIKDLRSGVLSDDQLAKRMPRLANVVREAYTAKGEATARRCCKCGKAATTVIAGADYCGDDAMAVGRLPPPARRMP